MRKWIALVEVVELSRGTLFGEDIGGAFANVVATAETEEEFIRLVEEYCAQVGLRMLSIEDVDDYEVRRVEHSVAHEIAEVAESVGKDVRVAFGTFHYYPRSDAQG